MNVPQSTQSFQLGVPVIEQTLIQRADAESSIRPNTTKAFTREWTEKPFEFPNFATDVPDVSFVSDTPIPMSTRSIVQNALLVQRHFGK